MAARPFTIELSETRAAQVQYMAEDLGLTEEAVIQLALNLAIGAWKAVVPGLEGFEAPVEFPATSGAGHRSPSGPRSRTRSS